MSVEYPKTILPPLVEKAQRALRKAVNGVIVEHRRTGQPLVLWRDGRVAYVDPESVNLLDIDEPPTVHEGK